MPEKAEYEIEFPVVEGYQDPGIVQVKVNWDRVGELVLDPDVVPDDVLLRGLTASDGRLIAYGPGTPVRVNLEAWRRGVRVQQVAFDLAKVLIRKWQEDRGDAIPVHRLFPQMLDAANRFIERTRHANQISHNAGPSDQPLFRQGDRHDGQRDGNSGRRRCESGEGRVRTRRCRSSITRVVNFHTGKELHDVQRMPPQCRGLRHGLGASGGRTARFTFDRTAWVKNDRLGLVIPYRKDGAPRKYLPDFVVDLKNGACLIVEIKGQAGDAVIKKAAADREREEISEEDVQELLALIEIPDAFMFQSIMTHPAQPDVCIGFAPSELEG